MKITIINGSARKGNTCAAINALMEGAEKHEIEIIQPEKLNIAPCMGCNACECYKGCVAKDDTNETVDRIVNSDLVVFATPVYWWGITAQLKLIIDKCYCKGAYLKNKKVGLIIIGGASIDNEQYNLIKSQFDCIAHYLEWDILFYNKYSATAADELAADASALSQLTAQAEEI